MIISHKHKFIFLKTQKTAGTSLEIALSKFCGPDDIISPLGSLEDYKLRKSLGYIGPQNYYRPLNKWSINDLGKLLVRKEWPKLFYDHISAQEIKGIIDKDIWSEYLKFTIVRNPWDRAVSYYYWFIKKHNVQISFRDLLLTRPQIVLKNWLIYTDNDLILVDYFIKYENLKEDLTSLSQRLGLSENIYDTMANINAKGNYRNKDKSKDALNLMDDFEKKLIGMLACKEAEYFNYVYPL